MCYAHIVLSGFLNSNGVIALILLKFEFFIRLGPRVKNIKNGNPESSKVCNSIVLKKYIWCTRNYCIANFSELHNVTRANKVW